MTILKPKIGAVFPQTEIGNDPDEIKQYVTAVESMGFDHILIYDHVLGVNTANRPNWKGAYKLEDSFHEVMVLFGYIAAITTKIELATGILVLPQRDTALVAKQAAELDILSNGRLRLGVGTGWNGVEFEALNSDFTNRGVRIEEQVSVLREFWTKELVAYEGKWHHLNDVGINPLPLQRPIPIWFGGAADAVMQRIGKMGDGWIYPGYSPFPEIQSKTMLDSIKNSAIQSNRLTSDIGVEKILAESEKPKDGWADPVKSWMEFGATHLSLNTMGADLRSTNSHLHALETFINEIIR
ncbi:MAG: Flavin-dependent oxidoreductase, luciferase family [Chloroflexi bacterium]|nr:MAG: Flavin-dependent oxidoreductase, luciferase family [Chloroflexota bacterium]